MAEITRKQWNTYLKRLRSINNKAVEDVEAYLARKGGFEALDRTDLIDYAYYVSHKYGEASAAASAQMYDAIAELSGAAVPSAVPAEITYQDVAKTVNGIIKNTGSNEILAQGVGRLVKMAGTDTILSNAYRDRTKRKGSKKRHSGAQVAWIPSGDTCAYCLMLASKGWQNQTEWGANNHSEHIHANCDCTYAVRFNGNLNVEGYDPEELRKEYYEAGDNQKDRLNEMRREQYAKDKDKINAQKRAAYAARKEASSPITDVTAEYTKAATPGKGAKVFDNGYNKKDHVEEVKFADWLHETLGGDIRVLKESDIEGQKMPDYIWNDKTLELKSVSSISAVDRQIHKAVKQIDESGMIAIDITNYREDADKLIKEIEYRFPKRARGNNDLMIKSDNDLVKIIRNKR